jgi:hypothetical protein
MHVRSQAPGRNAKVPRRVLAYLPDANPEFYGLRAIERAVVRHRDLTFLVVGDRSRRLLNEHPNVENIGWVEDCSSVYERVGCLVRLTRHDGYPRMVLDALLRHLYVVTSFPFRGCWTATNDEELDSWLNEFRRRTVWNSEGCEATVSELEPDPAERFASLIHDAVEHHTSSRRLRAAGLAGRWAATRMLRIQL